MAAQLLISAGSLGLVAILLVIIRLRPALYTVTMELGALSWLIGNLLWLFGWPIYHLVFWWAGFLVLTIAGERQELARLQQLSQVSQASFLFLLVSLLTVIVSYQSASWLAWPRGGPGRWVDHELDAEIVGLTGQVVPVDLEPKFLRQAGRPNVNVMRADIRTVSLRRL